MITAENEFYLFRMGNRTKLIYKQGALYEALNGNIIKSWETYKSEIRPDRYTVLLHCPHGIVEITEDNWKIPVISDSYSQLFWMDYKDEHIDCERFSKESIELYPYLGWAQAHFYDMGFGEDTSFSKSPLTWECQASQANYEGIRKLSTIYADAKYCSPHTWHSAETFLYLYEDIII